jgi:TolB-like protein
MRWAAMTSAARARGNRCGMAMFSVIAGDQLWPRRKKHRRLPFNLSDEKQNTFFTDGMQNEILANLAKVADLKVISRTSVMLYKAVTRGTCGKSDSNSAWPMC